MTDIFAEPSPSPEPSDQHDQTNQVIEQEEPETLNRLADHPSTSDQQPGALRGRAILTLQTRQAQRLVKGRNHSESKPAILGLTGFAHLLRSIWHGARADDPYADWWMLKVHQALETAQQEVAAAEQQMINRIETTGPIEVATPVSIKPARIALHFSNPYAFRAARLLGFYDGLVRTILSAHHTGLLARAETETALRQAGRHVRRALQSAGGYHFLRLTRLDINSNCAKSQKARNLMGDLPEDVVAGTLRAPYAPAIVVISAQATSDPTKLRSLPDLSRNASAE